DPAVVQAPVPTRIRWSPPVPRILALRRPLLCGLSLCWKLAVRWIDDERTLTTWLAPLQPVWRRRQRPAPGSSRDDFRRNVVDVELGVVVLRLLLRRGKPGCELCVRQLVARPQRVGAHEGDADEVGAGPDALQIGITPRRSWRRPGLRGGNILRGRLACLRALAGPRNRADQREPHSRSDTHSPPMSHLHT